MAPVHRQHLDRPAPVCPHECALVPGGAGPRDAPAISGTVTAVGVRLPLQNRT